MKMGVIALIGICVVFYQYHLSTGITFDQVTAFNADTVAEDAGGLPIGEEGDNYGKTPRLTENMVKKNDTDQLPHNTERLFAGFLFS